jgi:hypothetical protein
VRAGYVGVPAPGCRVKLVPVDSKFEVRFTGPHVMLGYWRAAADGRGVHVRCAMGEARHADADVTMFVARVTYALSKRTYLDTGVGRMDNEGTSAVALDAGGSVGAGRTQKRLHGRAASPLLSRSR